MKTSIVVIVLFLSINSFSQQADTLLIEPGSTLIDGSFIENYTNKWKVTFIDIAGNETARNIWTDYGEIMELKGIRYLHRVQDIYTPNLELTDTWINMVEHKTLQPWHFSSTKISGSNSFYQFSENILIINSNLNKEKKQKSDTIHFDKPIFDWNLYGILLVGLPFKEGAIYKFPYYSAKTFKVEHLIVKVEGMEAVKNLENQNIKTWKLSCSDGLVFWLTKEAPYVIQLELTIPNQGKIYWNSY